MSVKQLVKLYEQGSGADDVAGQQLVRMGNKARDKLIKMLDDPKVSKDDAGSIVMILFVYFRCEESIRALDRYADGHNDPKLRGLIESMKKMMRSGPPPR
jgi:hypothetical protein